jgi:hypothetical protein
VAATFPPKNHYTKNNLIVSLEKTPTSAVIGYVRRGIILHITRVPECPSLRPNWFLLSPLLQASVPPPLEPKGGQHSLAFEGVGGTNSDEWTESMALCVLCGPVPTYLLNKGLEAATNEGK